MNEVFRELAEQWRQSSDKDKQKYYDMYEDEVKRYEEMGETPHMHRGPLGFRKYALSRGLKINFGGLSSKRGKYGDGRRKFERETNVDEDDEQDDEQGW
jgi:hypothetical protein